MNDQAQARADFIGAEMQKKETLELTLQRLDDISRLHPDHELIERIVSQVIRALNELVTKRLIPQLRNQFARGKEPQLRAQQSGIGSAVSALAEEPANIDKARESLRAVLEVSLQLLKRK